VLVKSFHLTLYILFSSPSSNDLSNFEKGIYDLLKKSGFIFLVFIFSFFFFFVFNFIMENSYVGLCACQWKGSLIAMFASSNVVPIGSRTTMFACSKTETNFISRALMVRRFLTSELG